MIIAKDYVIIYLVMPGQENNICLHDYYYSLEEIAELFEGKLRGKIVHFPIKKLDLSQEEAQYLSCKAKLVMVNPTHFK
jgi:hypothetical protein